MIGIYLIRNKITDKIYIGQSNDILRRWREHKARAFNKLNNCYDKPLYRSIRKYGVDAFELEILCECEVEDLNKLEMEYIAKYNSLTPFGYNILATAEQRIVPTKPKKLCKQCGKPLNQPGKHQLCRECYTKSTRTVERPSSDELYTILISNNGNFTQVSRLFNVTDNAIRKWCKSYGLPTHSSDYKIPKNTKLKQEVTKIKIQQIDLTTGLVIAEFDSTRKAAQALGKPTGSHISEVCNGIHKSAYGYGWRYKKL